ncbi:MAG: hypothetical protein AAF974_09310, partial [Cyanobacteria bacterium P01_E01_bin.34]
KVLYPSPLAPLSARIDASYISFRALYVTFVWLMIRPSVTRQMTSRLVQAKRFKPNNENDGWWR